MDFRTIHRFQKYIELDILTGCWLWKASKDTGGYGRLNVQNRIIPAHRLSYQHWNGEIPTGKEIDHLCRNRSCVNPEHLEAVTHRENTLRGIIIKDNWQTKKTHCPQGH